MKTRQRLWIIIGSVLVAAAGLASWFLLSRRGSLVVDPGGRFSYRVADELEEIPTDGTFRHWRHVDPDIDSFIVAADAEMKDEAVAAAFRIAGIDYQALTIDGISGFGHWRLERFVPEDGLWYAVAYQYRGETAYTFIVRGDLNSDPDSLPAPVFSALASFSFTEDAGEVFSPDGFTELEEYIDSILAQTGGSVSIAAMKKGEMIYRYASGMAAPDVSTDIDTAYHWGSITKPVTATAVMQLVENGSIDLDRTIDSYLPEFRAGGAISVRNLLGHSSGLSDIPVTHLVDFGSGTIPGIDEVWKDYHSRVDAPEYMPGSSAVYSNANYLVLGILVERVTGERLTDYIRNHVFDPLGMEATAHYSAELPADMPEAQPVIPLSDLDFLVNELESGGYGRDDAIAYTDGETTYLNTIDILPCWGGVKGTASDALRFGQLFLDRGLSMENRILEPTSVREMTRPQKSSKGDRLPFGIGWRVSAGGRKGYFEHAGGGPGIDSLMRVYPGKDIVIVVFGNVVGYGSGQLMEYTYELVR